MESKAEGIGDRVEAFLASLAEGTLDSTQAMERALRLKDLLEDSLTTQEYPRPLPDGTRITVARKSQIEVMQIESQLQRITDWIARNESPEKNGSRSEATIPASKTLLPITWLKDKPQASIGWVYKILFEKGFIDCTAVTFYDHFVDRNGNSIKADAESARKSREPGSKEMKSLVSEIRRYGD